MAEDVRTRLKALLDLLESGQVDEGEAALMLNAAIMRQIQAPSYLAFLKAYRAYVDRQQVVQVRRTGLKLVDRSPPCPTNPVDDPLQS